ncbi:MAG: MBL fold metallo-hydrolase [Bacteroidales bacterium]
MIKVTFLGTGTSQGVPVIGCSCKVCSSTDSRDKRLRSSLLVEVGTKKIVIDAGPDFRYQLLRESIGDIDAILLTHEHKDHIGGLDDVRAINYNHNKALPIYCEERVANAIKRDYYYAFDKRRYPGVPRLNLNIIQNSPFKIEGVEVVPIRVLHGSLPIFGYKIGDFSYITDASNIEKRELLKVSHSHTLVLNTIRKESHHSHFCLEESISIAKESQVKRCYLTHLSHHIGLHQELIDTLPLGIEPAYDRLSIKIENYETDNI